MRVRLIRYNYLGSYATLPGHEGHQRGNVRELYADGSAVLL